MVEVNLQLQGRGLKFVVIDDLDEAVWLHH